MTCLGDTTGCPPSWQGKAPFHRSSVTMPPFCIQPQLLPPAKKSKSQPSCVSSEDTKCHWKWPWENIQAYHCNFRKWSGSSQWYHGYRVGKIQTTVNKLVLRQQNFTESKVGRTEEQYRRLPANHKCGFYLDLIQTIKKPLMTPRRQLEIWNCQGSCCEIVNSLIFQQSWLHYGYTSFIVFAPGWGSDGTHL